MLRKTLSPPNPRRVAAGRRNRQKRGPLTPQGRERLRQAALENKPWLRATGPRTPEGKARSAANGRKTQKGNESVREVRTELADVRLMMQDIQALLKMARPEGG